MEPSHQTSAALPLIVAPTSFEYAVVRRALRGWLAQGRGLCRQCGMGEARTAAFCQGLAGLPLSGVVLLGWAGGLAADLPAGAVVCADAAARQGQPSLPLPVLPLASSRVGAVLTVPRALSSPAEKRAAQAGGALAVEMEAYPMARWAQQAGLPFYHVRLVLDAVDEPLPDLGGPGLLRRLARLPGFLAELWRFGGRVRALNPRLALLVQEIAAQALLNIEKPTENLRK
jgi:hypothetical protein